MFTGIITEQGRIESTRAEPGGGIRAVIHAPATARGLVVGGSIAVDGVCLTAVDVRPEGFAVQVVPETLRRTTIGKLGKGRMVNLERPLTAAAELGGHFVQGHVDACAQVAGLKKTGKEVILEVRLPASIKGLIVEKGSIAVDGVSLTVASVAEGTFSVALIPHTLEVTTLGERSPGDAVNLEGDILAKYVASLGAR